MSILIRVIVNAVALWAAVFLVEGIRVTTDDTVTTVLVYLAVGAIFGLVNAVIKPIVKTVGCLFYVLTLGLVGLVVNALLLLLTDWFAGLLGLPFEIDGFWAAFWGAIIVAVVSWLLSLFVGGDDDE
ncbi:phage holin family protein [Actinorugispora endophytica]|uniref:Putative membrane protein n=1 Tax=Actinorugispora endophytica TaxID=1605990 RepID=A0A4R6V232_9ACTN|nr:phage holin family protein [Actinorugispora endophytica]TDQ52122.1 putative membrane protein [Actinorugispora endophytica]